MTQLSNKPGRSGLHRLWWATRYSMLGIKAAWKNEAAFREEILLLFVLIPSAFFLGQTAVERALLIGSALLLIIVELLNSAIEAAIDRIGTEMHPLSGQAKDMGSAAVFFTLLVLFSTWGLIAWQRFLG